MNEKNTDQLLSLIDKIIKLVSKNAEHIDELADEIAKLKAKK